MLKLTRELWALDPSDASYFDFYENALMNHLLGQQNPKDNHGHVTYFTPLNPGGRRGVGPAWGGGTWSTDYNSFWCSDGLYLLPHQGHTLRQLVYALKAELVSTAGVYYPNDRVSSERLFHSADWWQGWYMDFGSQDSILDVQSLYPSQRAECQCKCHAWKVRSCEEKLELR
ncbi:unnamed protein product [Fusarium graminearum]|nr:unnamed protein product [Fusarium graminearum]